MAYPVDIRSVVEALGNVRVVSDTLVLGDVVLGDRSFSFPSPASFDVTLVNSGAGIVASGTVRAMASTSCVRCLADFVVAVTGDVEGFYVRRGHEDGIPAEQDVEFIDDERIDLGPALVQAIVVDLPFAPLHSDDCAGICPICGVDRNVDACACEPEDVTSPFAGLKGLLGEGAAIDADGDDDRGAAERG
jgi:uncharacterized protein